MQISIKTIPKLSQNNPQYYVKPVHKTSKKQSQNLHKLVHKIA